MFTVSVCSNGVYLWEDKLYFVVLFLWKSYSCWCCCGSISLLLHGTGDAFFKAAINSLKDVPQFLGKKRKVLVHSRTRVYILVFSFRQRLIANDSLRRPLCLATWTTSCPPCLWCRWVDWMLVQVLKWINMSISTLVGQPRPRDALFAQGLTQWDSRVSLVSYNIAVNASSCNIVLKYRTPLNSSCTVY